MVQDTGDPQGWRIRWLSVLDMSERVMRGEDLDVFAISSWAAEARRSAEEDETRHRAKNRAGWADFAKEAVKRGGRAAHKWVNGLDVWVPTFAGDEQDPKYGPSEIAEECAGYWRDIWGCQGGNSVGSKGEVDDEAREEVERLLRSPDWGAKELQDISEESVSRAVGSFLRSIPARDTVAGTRGR